MIAVFFEFIFQILLELFLQITVEILFHLGWSSVAEALDRKPTRNPALAFIGYALLGFAAGGLSLLLFPELFVHHPALRIANLILTPVLAGWLMSAVGDWRERKGLSVIRLDSFAYGFIFAFGVAIIRYLFGAT
ncbi:MAG TPA: hypothetical protein VGB77_13680 [Abditibacteriaceae bacterium]|jgi:hypothetical protein